MQVRSHGRQCRVVTTGRAVANRRSYLAYAAIDAACRALRRRPTAQCVGHAPQHDDHAWAGTRALPRTTAGPVCSNGLQASVHGQKLAAVVAEGDAWGRCCGPAECPERAAERRTVPKEQGDRSPDARTITFVVSPATSRESMTAGESPPRIADYSRGRLNDQSPVSMIKKRREAAGTARRSRRRVDHGQGQTHGFGSRAGQSGQPVARIGRLRRPGVKTDHRPSCTHRQRDFAQGSPTTSDRDHGVGNVSHQAVSQLTEPSRY